VALDLALEASVTIRRGAVSVRVEPMLGLGADGKAFVTDVLKADPMSLRVSDRTRTVIAGAIAGT